MIQADTAAFVAERGAYCGPTLAIIFGLLEHGERLGFPAVGMDKLRRVADVALVGLERIAGAGVRMGFGTDLLGELQTLQSSEFMLRAQVLPAADILRSATSVNADLLGMTGEIGVVAPGAIADLLLVEGNPLADLTVMADRQKISAVVQEGRVIRGARTPGAS